MASTPSALRANPVYYTEIPEADPLTGEEEVFLIQGGEYKRTPANELVPLRPDVPTTLPPSGQAGGDLEGTYPDPTIGAGKVTGGKIANKAVTREKLGGFLGNCKIGTICLRAYGNGSSWAVTNPGSGQISYGSYDPEEIFFTNPNDIYERVTRIDWASDPENSGAQIVKFHLDVLAGGEGTLLASSTQGYVTQVQGHTGSNGIGNTGGRTVTVHNVRELNGYLYVWLLALRVA